MRKIMSLLVLLAMLLSLGMSGFAVAAADGALTPPTRPHMPDRVYDFSIPVSEVSASSSEIETVTPAVLGETAVWRATTAGTQYRFQLCNLESVTGYTRHFMTVYSQEEPSADNTFSYTIREPGEYWLICDVTNASGTTSLNIEFEVEERSGVETVASRVKEIVAECRAQVSAADEYATALWLHDWITSHSYYDLTFCYHGPDSILFYGTGVCDSYSKLYLLLMQEAGFEVERVTGGGHAWNCAEINGVWCQIDPTWDDPAGDNTAVSGDESHDYFGLNDEIMSLDHEYTVTRPCTSLLNCALRREGTVEVWLSHIWSAIEESFANGNAQNSFDTQGKLMAGGGAYYPKSSYVDEKYTVAAIILSQTEWAYQGNRTVTAKFFYDADSNTLSYVYEASGQMDPERTLALPASLTVIETEAFAGVNAQSILIPASVGEIRSGAFASCPELELLYFEGSPDSIAADAAAGCEKLSAVSIAQAENGAVKTWAEGNGLEILYH